MFSVFGKKIKEPLCGFKGQVTDYPILILQGTSLSDLFCFFSMLLVAGSPVRACIASLQVSEFSQPSPPIPFLPLSIPAARGLPGRAEQVGANARAPGRLCSAAGQGDVLLGSLCFMMLLHAPLYRPGRGYCETFSVLPWAGKMVQCLPLSLEDLSSGPPWWKESKPPHADLGLSYVSYGAHCHTHTHKINDVIFFFSC